MVQWVGHLGEWESRIHGCCGGNWGDSQIGWVADLKIDSFWRSRVASRESVD